MSPSGLARPRTRGYPRPLTRALKVNTRSARRAENQIRNARSNPHEEATVLATPARRALRWVVVTVFLLVQACDSTSAPSSGALRLIVRTTGGDVDLDGYMAVVDGTLHHVAVNDTLVVTDLATGNHTAALEGIAGNCTVSGVNAQAPSVRGG